jgi:hypothetical protein
MSVIGGVMVVGSQPTPNLDGIEADEVPHFEVGDSVFVDETADVAAGRVQETGQLVYGQQLVGKVYEFFGRGHRVDLLLIAGRIRRARRVRPWLWAIEEGPSTDTATRIFCWGQQAG